MPFLNIYVAALSMYHDFMSSSRECLYRNRIRIPNFEDASVDSECRWCIGIERNQRCSTEVHSEIPLLLRLNNTKLKLILKALYFQFLRVDNKISLLTVCEPSFLIIIIMSSFILSIDLYYTTLPCSMFLKDVVEQYHSLLK